MTPGEENPSFDRVTITMNMAPEPIIKAALMTLRWATVFCRNWIVRPGVPVEMVNDLMEAIHEVPSILLYWNNEHSLDMLVLHLSCFDERSWQGRVDGNAFSVPHLTTFFQERLHDFGYEGSPKQ